MRNLIVLALLVFLATSCHGQCNLRSRSAYQSYHVEAPVVVQKQQTLYYYSSGHYYHYYGGNRGPLYYYSGGTYHPYQDYHYKETVVLVPKAIQVEVQRDHYYSINQAARDDLLADAIVGRLLRLQKAQDGSRERTTTPDKRVPPDPKGNAPKGPKSKDKDLGDDRAGDYQEVAMIKTVKDSCAKCHGPSSTYTKFLTGDEKLTDLPSGKVWEAFGLVNSGEMPKGGKSLDDEAVKQFYSWAKAARKE